MGATTLKPEIINHQDLIIVGLKGNQDSQQKLKSLIQENIACKLKKSEVNY